ncbi:unnamed protein product [Scytosiphon promiscuus]
MGRELYAGLDPVGRCVRLPLSGGGLGHILIYTYRRQSSDSWVCFLVVASVCCGVFHPVSSARLRASRGRIVFVRDMRARGGLIYVSRVWLLLFFRRPFRGVVYRLTTSFVSLLYNSLKNCF